jgi:hypothetical protein
VEGDVQTLAWKPGHDKQLVFIDDEGKAVWTIETNGYPEHVAAWHDTVFWELSFPSETVVYAYEAGASAPSFTFDPKTLVSVPEHLPNDRLHIDVVGDELYVGLHQHLFLLDPATGDIERQWDLSALTGVPFAASGWDEPEFFYGGIEVARLTADADTLLVAFEARLLALDRPSGALLWHANPAAMPNELQPLVLGGLVVLTGGEEIAGPARRRRRRRSIRAGARSSRARAALGGRGLRPCSSRSSLRGASVDHISTTKSHPPTCDESWAAVFASAPRRARPRRRAAGVILFLLFLLSPRRKKRTQR